MILAHGQLYEDSQLRRILSGLEADCLETLASQAIEAEVVVAACGELARRVAEIVAAQGWRIENIDATILCQRPKLAPYIPVMREKLAAAFGLPVEAVSVKATTEEHLGFTGEGLGIAAHAVALIEAV